jgi:hypothetical protein
MQPQLPPSAWSLVIRVMALFVRRPVLAAGVRPVWVVLSLALLWQAQAYADPTALVICKTLTNNGDARNDSALFDFLPAGGALTLSSSVPLTVSETPTPNVQCSAPISLTGATALSVAQSATIVPAVGQPAWLPATGSYGWTVTGTGLSGVSGSSQQAALTPEQFSAASGTVTFTFTERRQRLITPCKTVEDNGDAIAN